MRLAAAIVGILFGGPIGAQSTADCDRGGVLSPAGIGPIRVGMPIDSLIQICRIISWTAVPEYSMTRHQVRIGADTATVWEYMGKVDFITIESPVHRTADSLGVGSSAEQVLNLPDMAADSGDGDYVLYARSGPYCGLTFRLDPKTVATMSGLKGDALRMLAMRGGGVVVSIAIRGACKSGSVQ